MNDCVPVFDLAWSWCGARYSNDGVLARSAVYVASPVPVGLAPKTACIVYNSLKIMFNICLTATLVHVARLNADP